MAKTYFLAPDGVACVSRNEQYKVKNGVFVVEDPDDVQAFDAQGYSRTGPPAKPQVGKQQETADDSKAQEPAADSKPEGQ